MFRNERNLKIFPMLIIKLTEQKLKQKQVFYKTFKCQNLKLHHFATQFVKAINVTQVLRKLITTFK